MRLLLISNMWPSPRDPVFGTFVERHVAALRRGGTAVTVIANTDTRTGAARTFVKYAALSARTFVAALGGGFDAVVGHYLYPTADFAAMAAHVSRRPYVLVAHGTDVTSVQRPGVVAKACRDALSRAALVVCVSSALERRLRDELGLPAGVPTAVVHMGVDTRVFRPDPDARRTRAIPEGERRLLFVGNLTQAKGVDVLLRAFADLRERGAADRLVLVGDGAERASLEALADDLGVRGALELTGRLTSEEVAGHMAAADVLVLPSRSEGLGLVLLEAMACGTPGVGSDVGGIPEALGGAAHGRLVPPDEAQALADAVGEVLTLGKTHFADACMAWAAENSTDAMAARFLASVAGVTGGRS